MSLQRDYELMALNAMQGSAPFDKDLCRRMLEERQRMEKRSMNIKPLHDRVVVERLPDEDQERSGLIYVPEVARKQSMKARVLAVGPGRWVDGEFVRTAVKPGDIVVLPGYGGQHPDWEGNQQMIIQEGDIGAVIG